MRRAALLVGVSLWSCAGGEKAQPPPRLSPQEVDAVALRAVQALEKGDLGGAEQQAAEVVKSAPEHPRANAVLAITRYRRAMHDLVDDGFTLAAGVVATQIIGFGGFNERYAEWALWQAETRLAEVDKHLEAASKDASLSLELCLACWPVDWNRDGLYDFRDQRLLQIEVDAEGQPYPDEDPRRSPTFHFDIGDVHWGRAMVGFQRAAIAVVAAYDLAEIDRMIQRGQRDFHVRMLLKNKASVAKAKQLVLAALESTNLARQAYLAETDDDREWLPNPKQKNHPLPLPVDDALYATWEGVLSDMQALMRGEEGLSVTEVAQLGDEQWENPPAGFVDVGRLFDEPGDLVLDYTTLDRATSGQRNKRDVEAALTDVLGNKYVPAMKQSHLMSRLARMKGELQRGEDNFERKLRYLFWLN